MFSYVNLKSLFFFVGALPHKFISEFDFRPLKFKLLPFATEILDIVRPRSTVGSVKNSRKIDCLYCFNLEIKV